MLIPSKGFNGNHRNSNAVLETRNMFSFNKPELSISRTAPPLCSSWCVNKQLHVNCASVIILLPFPWWQWPVTKPCLLLPQLCLKGNLNKLVNMLHSYFLWKQYFQYLYYWKTWKSQQIRCHIKECLPTNKNKIKAYKKKKLFPRSRMIPDINK